MLDVSMGQRIRQMRESLGLTRLQMSQSVGVTPGHIYKWEERGAEPTAIPLFKMAKLFNRPMEWIVDDSADHPDQITRIEAEARRLANEVGLPPEDPRVAALLSRLATQYGEQQQQYPALAYKAPTETRASTPERAATSGRANSPRAKKGAAKRKH